MKSIKKTSPTIAIKNIKRALLEQHHAELVMISLLHRPNKSREECLEEVQRDRDFNQEAFDHVWDTYHPKK